MVTVPILPYHLNLTRLADLSSIDTLLEVPLAMSIGNETGPPNTVLRLLPRLLLTAITPPVSHRHPLLTRMLAQVTRGSRLNTTGKPGINAVVITFSNLIAPLVSLGTADLSPWNKDSLLPTLLLQDPPHLTSRLLWPLRRY